MIVKGLQLRKPCLWTVEKNFAYYTPFIIPLFYPINTPIYYYFNILFYIIEFFHKVVNRDIKRLEMNELWRGQKSKNVEIYFSTKIEKVLYQ